MSNNEVTALKERAAAGDANEHYAMGLRCLNGMGPDNMVASECFILAAKQGHVEAQFRLGGEWYAAAAKQGHVEAQFNLGEMYYFGNGVERNAHTAAQWYAAASYGQGRHKSMLRLAFMYMSGDGVEQDYRAARKLYEDILDTTCNFDLQKACHEGQSECRRGEVGEKSKNLSGLRRLGRLVGLW